MASKNDITGDSIQTRAASEAYANNYDNIFGKRSLPEGRIAVKDLKHDMIVYDREVGNSYKVWKSPKIVNGQWQAEAEDLGNYEVIFYEHATLWTSEAARDAELGDK
jgi:hypothetical protein